MVRKKRKIIKWHEHKQNSNRFVYEGLKSYLEKPKFPHIEI